MTEPRIEITATVPIPDEIRRFLDTDGIEVEACQVDDDSENIVLAIAATLPSKRRPPAPSRQPSGKPKGTPKSKRPPARTVGGKRRVMPVDCPDCGRTCGSAQGLAKHRRSAHPEQAPPGAELLS